MKNKKKVKNSIRIPFYISIVLLVVNYLLILVISKMGIGVGVPMILEVIIFIIAWIYANIYRIELHRLKEKNDK